MKLITTNRYDVGTRALVQADVARSSVRIGAEGTFERWTNEHWVVAFIGTFVALCVANGVFQRVIQDREEEDRKREAARTWRVYR
jgi:hypothetical protein